MERKPDNIFKEFFYDIKPIRLKEPFAEMLGVFVKEDVDLEYTFLDVIKMTGHACPTTAGAYLCCRESLKKLYSDELPVRGDIAVTVYGEPDEGGYGVISQVFSLLTGAAPESGFKGLGYKFRRKDLLRFSPEKIDPNALCFMFRRLDNNTEALVKFYPNNIPFDKEKSRKLGVLLEKVLRGAAREDEVRQFQDLWQEKVRDMLIEEKGMNSWLQIECKGV